ncbi:hypothetical protein [uncultured Psychroserpens sp.]|uniref:hypothetical protein n=1 Tax=uncultured Psychroserpens sp. TaxID=255436 RepID=UPI00261A0E8B|nr:hypothetical protein [uncultured Psychroserpens sp.]
MESKTYLLILILIFSFISCVNSNNVEMIYKDQIGDTSFNPNLDDPEFKFCDSTNVLHKRAYISYSGGKRALEKAIIKHYEFKPEYSGFNGYFIVRFAINCNNEPGRIRIQVLDSNFNQTNCSEVLMQHIQTIFKNLKNWNHAIYKGEDYDGYTFHVIKIDHGKIQST